MTIEKARYWAENMTELSKNDRLWLNNPVIMQGVGLAPMVVAATSGYTALVLAAAVAVMLTPTRVGGAILRKALGEKYNRFAVLCYAFPAALCYIAAYFLVRHLWGPSALQQVGVYLCRKARPGRCAGACTPRWAIWWYCWAWALPANCWLRAA